MEIKEIQFEISERPPEGEILDLVYLKDLLDPEYLGILRENDLTELADSLAALDETYADRLYREDTKFRIVALMGEMLAYIEPGKRIQTLNSMSEILLPEGYMIIKDIPVGEAKDRRTIDIIKAVGEVETYRRITKNANNLTIVAEWQRKDPIRSRRRLLYNYVVKKILPTSSRQPLFPQGTEHSLQSSRLLSQSQPLPPILPPQN